jgi:hypothetical protein
MRGGGGNPMAQAVKITRRCCRSSGRRNPSRRCPSTRVAALAADPQVMDRTGMLWSLGLAATKFTD